MAKFDEALWRRLAPKFQELRGGQKFEKFLADNNFLGIKWRILEQGRQGMSTESLFKVCETLGVSPAWLLFDRGPKSLKELPIADPNEKQIISNDLQTTQDVRYKTIHVQPPTQNEHDRFLTKLRQETGGQLTDQEINHIIEIIAHEQPGSVEGIRARSKKTTGRYSTKSGKSDSPHRPARKAPHSKKA